VNNRRRFLRCAGVGLIVIPARAFAQAQGKVYRIGYLNLRAGPGTFDDAFVRGMHERGYVVGRNLVIEYRWAGGDMQRLQMQADELARLNVDVIVTAAIPAISAAMRATSTIPIVMTAVADPVGIGLVASLGRPGGNVTGMTLQSTDLARKRLQLMRDIIPGATPIAILTMRVPDTASDQNRQPERLLLTEMQAAARHMGIGLVTQAIASTDELPEALAQFRRDRAQAVFVQANPLSLQHRSKIVELTTRQQLPAMYEIREFVDDGGLVSYGPDLRDMYRRAARYVDLIFKGAKPGELAIEQPTKLELVINLKAAKALGLTITQSMLLRADEVIQ
jgi:putative ABC transport system substrate-binding protein